MNIIKKTQNAVILGSTSYSSDRLDAINSAIVKEYNNGNDNAAFVLELILENAEIANNEKRPLCDDTGIPHVIIEIGQDAIVPHNLFSDIKSGIAKGLEKLPGRPMAVKGNDISRLEQNEGLFNSPELLDSAPFLVENVKGNKIKISILLLGGGPEIRAKTYRVFHKRSYKTVLAEPIQWLKESLPQLGCTPSIPAIGIGRTHYEANSLMLKAMAFGNLNNQSELENYISKELNNTNTGPMGLGGSTTVLGTFLNIGPQRASGVRIVSCRPLCFVEPRISSFEL
ncbi:MAG: fumarate hydratase [Methanobacteriaceae archaeon]